nr:NUDIX hydrolase [Gordonia jinhuaensis]
MVTPADLSGGTRSGRSSRRGGRGRGRRGGDGARNNGTKNNGSAKNNAKASGASGASGTASTGPTAANPTPKPAKPAAANPKPGNLKPGNVKPGGKVAGTKNAGTKNSGAKNAGTRSGGTATPAPQAADLASQNARSTTPRLRTVRETSAGGLVVAGLDTVGEDLRAALIGRVDRRGRMLWSLPKGHIETGETAEQTAVREVAEETGIEGKVVASLGKIDYWFVSEGKRIHKTVHHYLMRFTGGELSDADYEVSEVAWVPFTELPRRLTYSDERRLARLAEGVIADLTGDPDKLAQSEAKCTRTEPNAYEKAAAARNQHRNDPVARTSPRNRRRRRGGRRRSTGHDTGGPSESARGEQG